MKQLDLFSFERDVKVDEVFSLAKAYDPNFEIAAVFLPDEKACLDEPSFAIKHGGKLRFYEICRGRVHPFRDRVLDTAEELPNKRWIQV
ncbi:hypothetical protein [Bacillus mesophilum]|uniref:Uncharacterized protein n=1 Tax=Bacillus mesophilum TaxID=1071718 RepID=A0A7V7RNF7_9BACI|nr:hypothetical protein [Bacillus mesophilum]KAB2333989.1 hypothetical protein F7732_07870 [Bacillus mesophilum]